MQDSRSSKWLPGGVALPLPDDGQQIQWGSNVQQLGRGASKIVLDGGTGNVTMPGVLTVSGASAGLAVSCPSAYGNVRVAPSTAGLESAISFSRNPNHTFTNRGDTWIVGRNVFGVGDRNFAIARFGPDAGNALTISEDGTVNVIGALNVAGAAVQRIPYVSCRISGNTSCRQQPRSNHTDGIIAAGRGKNHDLDASPPCRGEYESPSVADRQLGRHLCGPSHRWC
jgi:hypothetical protein